MAKEVTVDAEELFCILQATGTMKTIEEVLHQRIGDPFVKQEEHHFKAIHEKLAKACRSAMRGESHPQWNEPVKNVGTLHGLSRTGMREMTHQEMKEDKELFELNTKGMVEFGSRYDIIFWSNAQTQQRINQIERIMVRITPRGQAYLDKLQIDAMQATIGQKKSIQ